MSSAELTDWIAFERLYGPLGLERADFQAALVASVIANVNRKRSTPYEPSDFMPRWSTNENLTPTMMRTMLVNLTRRMGGKVVDKE